MKISSDIAIVGSGFAGSILAMIARRLGRSVVLIERDAHPRFAIGESSTPLANLLLGELATTYDLPRLLPLCKWGSWQATYPQLKVGLKRGFTFYHHEAHQRWKSKPGRQNQLMVAASPNDRIADTHWYRADVDHFLLEEARRLGADYVDHANIESVQVRPGSIELKVLRPAGAIEIDAKLVVDATGAGSRLKNLLGVTQRPMEAMPATETLYSHFEGVEPFPDEADPLAAPYPPDAAAVHHVFDGGWIWSLRFNDGQVSAGVVAQPALARELKLEEGEAAWKRLLSRLPSLADTFASARALRPLVYSPYVHFQSAPILGTRWVLLPSAAGFVDPLLSSGFPLTLLGIARLGKSLAEDWHDEGWQSAMMRYAATTERELEATALLVGALHAAMGDFERFTVLSLLYFAAASFSEVSRRLGRSGRAKGFLLHDHPVFGPQLRDCCQTMASTSALSKMVRAAIEPIDIAGLSRADRDRWYPVDPTDTLDAAAKLGCDRDEVMEMLCRCGLESVGV